MKVNEHTNLLSIFAWVYAGLQGMMFLFFLLYLVFIGGMAIFAALDAKGDQAPVVLMAVIFVVIAFLMLFGLASIVSNIVLGRRLRSSQPPTQRFMIVNAILNFLSFLCGGIILMPFGIGLGVYGLWFALSDGGKAYLSGRSYLPNYVYPPSPEVYRQNQEQPYRWQ